jgi:hypothetical protein
VSISPKSFIQLLDNRYRDARGVRQEYAVIGFLPLSLGGLLPTLSPDIRLGYEYAWKIVQKHGRKFDEIPLIRELIEDSYCFREKENNLTFMGYAGKELKPYTLVIKSSRGGTETWLVTFHRTADAQIASKVRRARAHGLLLRDLDRPFDE